MHIPLVYVTVPDTTTRFLTVPEYDLPIIRLLWKGRLKPDNPITIEPLGTVATRSLHDEMERIREEYKVEADAAPGKHAWQAIYPTAESFEAAYRKAMAEGEAILRRAAQVRTEPEAQPDAEEDQDAEGAAAAPLRRGRGRPRAVPTA